MRLINNRRLYTIIFVWRRKNPSLSVHRRSSAEGASFVLVCSPVPDCGCSLSGTIVHGAPSTVELLASSFCLWSPHSIDYVLRSSTLKTITNEYYLNATILTYAVVEQSMIDSVLTLAHPLYFLQHEIGKAFSCFRHRHVGLCLWRIMLVLPHYRSYPL